MSNPLFKIIEILEEALKEQRLDPSPYAAIKYTVVKEILEHLEEKLSKEIGDEY